MTQMQLPTYLQKSTLGIAAKAKAGIGSGFVPYVSIEGNRFTLIDAVGMEKPIDTLYLDVVIADANEHRSRAYYSEAYNASATEFKPPNCWSDNGVAPSVDARDPQHPTCAGCQWAVWGSKVSAQTGKGIPACQESKKLAVLVPGMISGGEPMAFMLKIPPKSLKNFDRYINELQATVVDGQRVDPIMVVTRITFASQGVLAFQGIAWIDGEMHAFLERKGENPYPMLTGAQDRPRVTALPGPNAPAEAPSTSAGFPTPGALSAPTQATFASPPSNAVAGAAPLQSPSEPAKRHRRTKAEMEAARAAEAAQKGNGFTQPAAGPAMFGGAPAPQPAPVQQAQPAQQFGIVQNAPAPDAALSEAISNAFKLPM